MPPAIEPVLKVYFCCSAAGHEPAGDWLKSLAAHERQMIGEDIQAVQFRWPLGMPLAKKLTGKVWEVRTQLPNALRECCSQCEAIKWFCCTGSSKNPNQTQSQTLTSRKAGLIFNQEIFHAHRKQF